MKLGISSTGGAVPPSAFRRGLTRSFGFKVIAAGLVCVTLNACVSGGTIAPPTASAALACDDGLKAAMRSHTDTKVLLVTPFKKDEPLLLAARSPGTARATAVEAAPSARPPVAGADLCLVKLLVGPGNPGPAGAPPTSAGIGIEILLPSHTKWNQRVRAYGNSGWDGTPQASLNSIASDDLHAAAAAKGFVVATSDHGHVASVIDPSYAMNPDGSINTVGWRDFRNEACMCSPRRPRR
jgi:feruloyl esterase